MNGEDHDQLEYFRYDGRTGELIGRERMVGVPGFRGERIYALPLNCTINEPPETPPGQKAVYIEHTGHWVVVSDHRGEVWFDWKRQPVTIQRLGDPALWGLKREQAA